MINGELIKIVLTQRGELPFTLIIFNQSNSDLNNGLEGFKKLKGVYKFNEKNTVKYMTKIALYLSPFIYTY